MALLKRLKTWLIASADACRSKFKRRPKSPVYPQGFEALSHWQNSPLGKQVLMAQKTQLDTIVEEVFGYHFLAMSAFDAHGLTDGSPIHHRFQLSLINPLPGLLNAPVALAQFESLPLEDESVDVVLMHHVLEYSQWPHQILREAARVTIPRGTLIVCGFNPWSLQGLFKLFGRWFSKDVFWHRSSLRKGRLLDWLRLLDCEPVSCHHGFYRPPINNQKFLDNMSFLERFCRRFKLPFGGYYIVVARKDVVAMTPLKPVWPKLSSVSGIVAGSPAARVDGSATSCHNLDK